MPNIVEIAVSNDNFKTLVAAVQAAGLVEALQSPGPFTVFAPVDAAFAALPPGTVQTLVQNPPQLARILKFHVVAGKFTQADLAKLGKVDSLEGSPISIDCSDGFEVKNSTVIAADIEADNGIIHVIDRVILMG
ncbi:fasciclin domain-containing protein [Chamaesiphon minutus]|uniref:Secreted/surface protein with fasciclin-like repeats n=1 Tax=Chamaesiphon minutus (strain ATCC 27169 / PCC 6605) TaxID=1173020 RepID=K9UBD7_CHAP6|nr:fasciclin domain-containing protein [Chamaesiphon minutus]AFY91746.1 secreted/surface protein with fasciclin-like repeats [Chamaesiphon minutus PCC 6605]